MYPIFNSIFGKNLSSPGVFIGFGPNLAWSIPRGMSKILMREILKFSFFQILRALIRVKKRQKWQKWPFLDFDDP